MWGGAELARSGVDPGIRRRQLVDGGWAAEFDRQLGEVLVGCGGQFPASKLDPNGMLSKLGDRQL
jgi:hypothetical protein